MTTESFEQNLLRLEVFSERVAALPPDAWARLRSRHAQLCGSTPSALLARTELAAAPYAIIPPDGGDVPAIRLIQWTFGGIANVMFGAKELAFAVAPSLNEPTRPRTQSTGKPRTDRYVDAMHRIRGVTQALGPYQLGLSTLVQAVAEAILRRTILGEKHFRHIYSWIESEIPLSMTDPSTPAS
jgi:hypothetical protein